MKSQYIYIVNKLIKYFKMTYTADENGNIYNNKGYQIKQHDDGNGYLTFNYCNSGCKSVKSHRFIWEYFNGEIPKGYQIDHINHIRNDNKLDNLRIVTPKVNIRRKRNIKLNIQKVYIIRKLYELNLLNSYQLAKRYGVDQSLISRIINNKVWI